MFELTQTFLHETGFHITPIHMEGVGLIFLLQEIEEQLGYKDLPNVIRDSESFMESKEYLILRNSNLRQFKELLNLNGNTVQVLRSIYEMIKHSPCLIVLTEPGLYTAMILSRKPMAVIFRRWVTCEILPSIRKTGVYVRSNLEKDGIQNLFANLIERLDKIENHMHKMEEHLEYLGFGVGDTKYPNVDYDKVEKINHIMEEMSKMYQLAEEEKRGYFTLLCQEYKVSLPQKALEVSGPIYKDLSEIAKDLCLYTNTGRPHATLVGAIIRKLNLDQEKYQQKSRFTKNGHQGITTKYSTKIIPLIYEWLQRLTFPTILSDLPFGKNKKTRTFQVKYKTMSRAVNEV